MLFIQGVQTVINDIAFYLASACRRIKVWVDLIRKGRGTARQLFWLWFEFSSSLLLIDLLDTPEELHLYVWESLHFCHLNCFTIYDVSCIQQDIVLVL